MGLILGDASCADSALGATAICAGAREVPQPSAPLSQCTRSSTWALPSSPFPKLCGQLARVVVGWDSHLRRMLCAPPQTRCCISKTPCPTLRPCTSPCPHWTLNPKARRSPCTHPHSESLPHPPSSGLQPLVGRASSHPGTLDVTASVEPRARQLHACSHSQKCVTALIQMPASY